MFCPLKLQSLGLNRILKVQQFELERSQVGMEFYHAGSHGVETTQNHMFFTFIFILLTKSYLLKFSADSCLSKQLLFYFCYFHCAQGSGFSFCACRICACLHRLFAADCTIAVSPDWVLNHISFECVIGIESVDFFYLY